jgi:hypothetical protein
MTAPKTVRVHRQALWAARFFAALGTLIILVEVARNWIGNHRIEGWVVAIGAAFGFIGFYLLDSTGALTAFGFLRDSTVQIIGVVRSGRRATDPIVPQVSVAPAPTDPAAPPQTPGPDTHVSGQG